MCKKMPVIPINRDDPALVCVQVRDKSSWGAGGDECIPEMLVEYVNPSKSCCNHFFQEYDCHKDSKVKGLSCLRKQLTGESFLQ
jgi:hypothetical protein